MDINSKSLKTMIMTSVLLLLMLDLTFVSGQAGGGSGGYEKWGPRTDYLQFIIYGTYESTVAALRAGSVDIMDWPLDYDTYMLIKDDPNFVIEPLTMYDCYDIDINCLRWPTSDYRFRQAIAHLIDYETFYTNILRAFTGGLMDNIIWWQWIKWYNPDAHKYWYDVPLALDILADAGYQNLDADPQLEWWNASSGTKKELPNLEFYAREDDPLRAALGTMLNAQLNAIGIPTAFQVATKQTCWRNAYQFYTYHLYTAGMGPFPDPQFLYDYYHSKFATPDIQWCMNNVLFMNATYDYWVEQFKFAADDATAVQACKEAQAIFMDQVPLIPVYQSAGAKAYRAEYGHHGGEEAYWDMPWNGVVNSIIPTVDSGINDYWTLLNAHPGDVVRGGVLRYGWMSDVDHVNPVTVYSVWDAYLLEELYSTMIMRDPFTGARVPWLAKDWTTETWDYGGKNATKLTMHLYENLKWSDGTPLNSTDVAFTMKYMYDASSPSYYPYVETIDGISTTTPHIETPDANTVVIYYTVESIWVLEWAGDTPIIPKRVWQTVPPKQCDQKGEFTTTGNLTCSGPYLIDSYKRGEWWLLRANPYFFRNSRPGDLGSGPPPTFFAFDGVVDAFDYALWKACYDGTAPPNAMYLGDLGSGPPPTFFAFDGVVDAFDYALWKACYDGLGPP
jgi:ABC-type transport system substrate-binding protein